MKGYSMIDMHDSAKVITLMKIRCSSEKGFGENYTQERHTEKGTVLSRIAAVSFRRRVSF